MPINDGGMLIVSAFKSGSAEDCRHSNQTIIYDYYLSGTLYIDGASAKLVQPVVVYFWLIYDSEPRGKDPGLTDVFRTPWRRAPSTWVISRSASHRFVIKRHWTHTMTSDGLVASSNATSTTLHNPVPTNILDVRKYVSGLNVPTEWMSLGDGTIGDIKKGALYIVFAARQGLSGDGAGVTTNVNFVGQHRVYFRSVGNQ